MCGTKQMYANLVRIGCNVSVSLVLNLIANDFVIILFIPSPGHVVGFIVKSRLLVVLGGVEKQSEYTLYTLSSVLSTVIHKAMKSKC